MISSPLTTQLGCKAKGIQEHTLSLERMSGLMAFCDKACIRFTDMSLLEVAFHHRSRSNEYGGGGCYVNNERLEFLGDSVLGLSAASYLYDRFDSAEGTLAKIKAAVVSEKALFPVALRFGVDKLLLMSRGEEKTGGRAKPAVLADCMEAIIGAYYLDAGYEAAKKFVLSFLAEEVDKVIANKELRDYKSLLQELYQKHSKQCPRYEVINIDGPEHSRTFTVEVTLGESTYGPATGHNKKEAEQNAAKIAYCALHGED